MLYPEPPTDKGIGGNFVLQYPEPAAGEGIGRNYVTQYPESAAGIAIMRIYGLVYSAITRYNRVNLCKTCRNC